MRATLSAANPLSVYSSTTLTVIVACLHYLLSYIARQFTEVYAGLGAELPFITQVVLGDGLYYWIVPIGVAGSFALHHWGYLSRKHVLLTASLGTVLSIFASIFGLYLPVVQLGAVVQ